MKHLKQNETEILKIIGVCPKASKSGLKRSAEHASCRKQECREVIITDRYDFGKKGLGSFALLAGVLME